MAILLIGGNKAGNEQFYREMIPVADRLFDAHLAEIDLADKGSRRK